MWLKSLKRGLIGANGYNSESIQKCIFTEMGVGLNIHKIVLKLKEKVGSISDNYYFNRK